MLLKLLGNIDRPTEAVNILCKTLPEILTGVYDIGLLLTLSQRASKASATLAFSTLR